MLVEILLAKFLKTFAAICLCTGLLLSCKAADKFSSSDLNELDVDQDPWFDFFRPTNVAKLSLEELQRQKLKAKIKIFKLEMLDLLGLNAGANISFKHQGNGSFQRTETWRLDMSINPGTLITASTGTALPINLVLQTGRDIEYVRQFPSQSQAATAPVKTFIDLPLTVNKALAMEPGDIASLPVTMGMRLSVGKNVRATGADTGVFWHGGFRLTIFRLDGGFVRIKAVSDRSRGLYLNAQVSAHLDYFGYGPFGLVNLDREAEKGLGLDFLKFTQQKVQNGEKLVIDYVINLDHPDGAIAYAGIVEKTLRVRPGKLAAYTAGASSIDDSTFANIDYAEILNDLDANKSPVRKRAARVFRGSNSYSGRLENGHFGTKLLRYNSDQSLTFNTIDLRNSDNSDSQYRYFLFNKSRSKKSLLSPLRNQHELTAAAIFVEGRNGGAANEFVDFAFALRSSERRLTVMERNDLIGSLTAIFGPVYEELRLYQAMPRQIVEKYGLTAEIAFPRALLAEMYRQYQDDPEHYEKLLWYAMYQIAPQFSGRLGPRTAGSADTALGSVRNFFKNSLETLRNSVRAVIRLRFEGIHGQTATDLIRASNEFPVDGSMPYFERIMRLLEKDDSAEEIVPAFFIALAAALKVDPYIAVRSGWDGDPYNFEKISGENSYLELEDFLAGTYKHINSLGYDR
jgi:hypothetical protein